LPTAHAQVAVCAWFGAGAGSGNLIGCHLQTGLLRVMVGRHIFNVASGAVAGILVMGKARGLPAIGSGVAGDTCAGVMPGRAVGVVARPALFNVGVVKPVGNP